MDDFNFNVNLAEFDPARCLDEIDLNCFGLGELLTIPLRTRTASLSVTKFLIFVIQKIENRLFPD